jgi:hypothetical protein
MQTWNPSIVERVSQSPSHEKLHFFNFMWVYDLKLKKTSSSSRSSVLGIQVPGALVLHSNGDKSVGATAYHTLPSPVPMLAPTNSCQHSCSLRVLDNPSFSPAPRDPWSSASSYQTVQKLQLGPFLQQSCLYRAKAKESAQASVEWRK